MGLRIGIPSALSIETGDEKPNSRDPLKAIQEIVQAELI